MTEEQSDWFVYMLRCGDGSLYTGISTDVERRIREHEGAVAEASEGDAVPRSRPHRGAKYLRGRGPLTLVFKQGAANRSSASRLEYRIKNLSKSEKEALARGAVTVTKLLERG